MKPIIFIDNNVLLSAPETGEGSPFVPGAIAALGKIASDADYYKVLLHFAGDKMPDPDKSGDVSQQLVMKILAAEGWVFDEVLVADNSATLESAMREMISRQNGDTEKNVLVAASSAGAALADYLPGQKILLSTNLYQPALREEYKTSSFVKEAKNWREVEAFIKSGSRKFSHKRFTKETQVTIDINLDGSGKTSITTGLGFFDHMLEQVARHSKCDLSIVTNGDLHIDEHHTIEDTGIALGEVFVKALGDKVGLERYGFVLPMDEAAAKVLIDFGGRPHLEWQAVFTREKVGDMPTEMFYHFFKSFSDAAKCTLHIECSGTNEHHKIEVIFKAFAKAIAMAIKRDPFTNYLPSTKGIL
jgi:imidazoleglycerol-phosphate dehydratase/histidinol-phosphatase